MYLYSPRSLNIMLVFTKILFKKQRISIPKTHFTSLTQGFPPEGFLKILFKK